MDQDRLHQHGATLPGCCLLLLTILAYLPALDAGFIIDDSLYVTDDARMETGTGLGGIWTEVVGREYQHQYYPLTSTAFWVQHQLWGDQPFGYHLVNADESDPPNGRISVSSPIGKALIGKVDGDEVEVQTPRGTKVYEILEFSTVHEGSDRDE